MYICVRENYQKYIENRSFSRKADIRRKLLEYLDVSRYFMPI